MLVKIFKNENEKMMRYIIKNASIVVLSPALITIILYYAQNNDIKLYNTSLELFTAVLAFSMGIIAMLKKYKDEEKMYTLVGLGFLIIGILKFSNVFVITQDYSEFQYRHLEMIEFVIYFTTYFSLILSFNSKFRQINSKNIYKVYVVLLILFIIGASIIINSLYLYTYFNYFISIALILFLVLTIFASYNCKYRLQKIEKIMFIIYLIFILIAQGIKIYSIMCDSRLSFIEYLFNYLSMGIMYNILETNFFYKSYEKEKQLLEKSQDKQKALNEILKIKNKDLIELKSIIEKSEKKQTNLLNDIKDSILIMSLGRVSYINKATIDVMNIDIDVDNVIGMNSKEIFNYIKNKNIISNQDILKITQLLESEFDERKLYKLQNIKKNELEFEVYFVNKLDRLFYVKDVTYINENEKVRISYEKYLKEERLKDEFYSNISHELRTPINLIFSALQVNDIYLVDQNLNGVIKNNKTIKQNCLRLIRTINNFIDANKISEGYISANMKIHNIVDIVENISLACRRYIDKIDNKIIFDSVEEEIYALVDKEMIERVMLNLLSNSVKYGGKGAIILINIDIAEEKVIIEVNNNLYTISEDIKPFIFDKFSKLNKAFNREREGSGLGLFLTKALLELQGGTIDVDSNEEIGTKFIITLPIYFGDKRTQSDETVEMNSISDKVDTEFSDIYF